MAKQIMENESRVVEAKCDLAKYCIDKSVGCIGKTIDCIGKTIDCIGNLNPKKVGVVVMALGLGIYIAGRTK